MLSVICSYGFARQYKIEELECNSPDNCYLAASKFNPQSQQVAPSSLWSVGKRESERAVAWNTRLAVAGTQQKLHEGFSELKSPGEMAWETNSEFAGQQRSKQGRSEIKRRQNKALFSPANLQPEEGFLGVSGCRRGCAMPGRSTWANLK